MAPGGVVRSWDLDRWLDENPWEGEDGPSVRSLCLRDYFWDAPMCWLDERTLAVYGFGEDADWMIPAVRVFDVTTGEELRWFPGPTGLIESDGTYLFSWDESGMSVSGSDRPENASITTRNCIRWPSIDLRAVSWSSARTVPHQ